MKPDPQGEGRRWFLQAGQDLEAARVLTSAGHHNLACFHCQQAVEKALKAFLFSRGAWDVRGHGAGALCEDAATLDPAFRELRSTVAPVDKYCIPTRYPNGLGTSGLPFEVYDADDSARAIRIAEQALDFVERRLAGGRVS